jgi:hypothetical protein
MAAKDADAKDPGTDSKDVKDPGQDTAAQDIAVDAPATEEPAREPTPPTVPDPINIAHLILERLLVKLQDVLLAEDWLASRLIVCFFARLTQTPTPVVTLETLASLLQELVQYLDGTDSLAQKDRVALVVGEALLLLPPAALPEIQQAVVDHGARSQKTRYDSLVEVYTENVGVQQLERGG